MLQPPPAPRAPEPLVWSLLRTAVGTDRDGPLIQRIRRRKQAVVLDESPEPTGGDHLVREPAPGAGAVPEQLKLVTPKAES